MTEDVNGVAVSKAIAWAAINSVAIIKFNFINQTRPDFGGSQVEEIHTTRICTASTISVPTEIAPIMTTVSPGNNRACSSKFFSASSTVFCGSMKSSGIRNGVTPQFMVNCPAV